MTATVAPKALIDFLLGLGRGQSPSYVEGESPIRAINQKCVRNGVVDVTHARGHDPLGFVKDFAFLRDGDVCINSTGTGTIGRVGVWVETPDETDQFFADSHVTIARPDVALVNPCYLAAVLQNPAVQAAIETYCFSGSTNQIELNKTALSELELCLLSRDEQDAVAGIKACIDRAIEQTATLIAKQQRIKTGLMQDLLTKGIDAHGNIRSEATHTFKDSPLGRIPMEWEVRSLDALLTDIKQGWSPDCESEPAGVGEWGVLKTTAVVWEGFNSQENKRLPSNLRPRPALGIRAGDILMTRAGPNSRVGVVCYVYETEQMRILSDKLYLLETTDALYGRFLAYSLSGFAAQRHLSNLKTGMAESQTNISQDIVRKLLTVAPNLDEQRQIADLLDMTFSSNKNNEGVLLKLKKLKHGLMNDLLTGELLVSALLAPAATS